MKAYFAYIRVSTVRQGEQGVSLQEQRDAIQRYAAGSGLTITQWFEEKESAARRGRPLFAEMLRRLKKEEAAGVLIHKIDRSARNLRDWAELGELIDHGIEVHFANESLDLHSRGGRLSADIQAVVAADYVRNLKEEIKKGFYGRLKQGLYPLPAPLGYLDRGKGKPKEIDPVSAPLVRRAFELYATGNRSLDQLVEEVHALGLRNHRGGRVTRTGLSTILNNPFYVGIIRLKRTGETFAGTHEPLIPKRLFDRVQHILRGKTIKKGTVHDYPFRRLFTCALCGYSLIGELQKGHVYYRCHTKGCPTLGLREEAIEEPLREKLRLLTFNEFEQRYLRSRVQKMRNSWHDRRVEEESALALQVKKTQARLARLTNIYLDGEIEKALFDERKEALLLERRELDDRAVRLRESALSLPDRLEEFLELAETAYLSNEMGLPEEKRDLLRIVTSNRRVSGKNVMITLSEPFAEVAERARSSNGAAYRARPRTLDKLLAHLIKYFSENEVVLPERSP